MRFFQTLFAGAAFIAATAALEINDFPKSVEPGKTYTVTYSPVDNTPTTFILREGKDQNDLNEVVTLTTTATGGKFQWKVDSSLPNADDYALEIKQGTTSNYIGPIGLTGSDATAAASSSKVASSTAASSSAAPSTVITTVSGAVSSSAASNGTVSSPTLSRTASGTSAPSQTHASTTTGGGGAPQNTGAASTLGSPLALLLSGFAAMVYFN